MVTGRVGSAIAAELGSMTVSQQIDAMRALGTDPVRETGSATNGCSAGQIAAADRDRRRGRNWGRRHCGDKLYSASP